MKRKYLLILGLLFVMLEGIIMQSCKVGFKKEKGKCVDEDECKPKLICGENASCFNTDGSYYCQCQAGFKPEGTKPAFNFTQGDGIECKDINECVEKNINCGSNAKCENTVGGYYCTCESGFTSSSGNKTSSTKLNCVDINECVNASINCGLNAECVNNQGGYACRCRTGYAPNNGKQTFIAGQGVQCDDIDECEDENTDCGSNAECENTEGGYYCTCESGVVSSSGNKTFLAGLGVQCVDINECVNASINCGPNAECVNNQGGYACICRTGYAPNNGNETFIAGQGVQCGDRNECDNINCGKNAMCHNTPGHFYCSCSAGFTLKSGETNFTDTNENCESVCDIDKSICGGGTCKNTKDGHECLCSSGFTNSGHKQRKCTEFDYETFKKKITAVEANPELAELVFLMNSSSEALKQSKFQDGEKLLEKFLSALEGLLRDNDQLDNKKASAVFNIAESMLKLTGLMLTRSQTKKSTTRSDVELLVKRESSPPVGPFTLSTNGTWFTSHWDTATGNDYMGFTTVALLSYTGLEESLSRYFNHLETQEKQTFKINSEIVTATVSNKDTAELKKPVHFKFSHLKKENVNHICVFWDHDLDGGAWSTRNCSTLNSTAAETVCSCSHLSSFAVLMALYDIGDVYELRLISWVGLSLSLVCLLICIVTFYAVRSIQSTRNTIHMHLCISLFIAYFVFLVGISRTENKVGCSVVAGVLHYFFLASFCWMCLEGVQLFRMVVLVFNTTLRHIYMFAAGYGVPALIVAISASVNASGYGTPNYCWLNIDDGFIWSFYGPVCIIIVVNVFFFLITIWKLAEKFSSLNPDLDNLRKIKAFIVTAIAQLCVLGIMWVFGCFQFDSNSLAVSYIFTILGSLQGVLMFIMHCWLSKQVRDEYAKFLSCICAPQKRKYSEFSSNQTSKSQASKSVQHTGESQI